MEMVSPIAYMGPLSYTSLFQAERLCNTALTLCHRGNTTPKALNELHRLRRHLTSLGWVNLNSSAARPRHKQSLYSPRQTIYLRLYNRPDQWPVPSVNCQTHLLSFRKPRRRAKPWQQDSTSGPSSSS